LSITKQTPSVNMIPDTHTHTQTHTPVRRVYEAVSKIFRSGSAIYTAVVVARSNGPKGQTVNSGFCCDVFRQLRENLRRRRPELWREKTWLLHHDNAPSHTSVLTQQLQARYKMAVIPHPPYSTDLVTCELLLFPKMKLKLKRHRFGTTEEIQT
jgi:hypothetical protein